MSYLNDSTKMSQLVAKMIVILFCLSIHEFAHAFTASKLGDNTARTNGRVTLNPFVHLDVWGTLMIFVFGIGYAKPVPVNIRNLREPKKDYALISIAGPLSNLIIAIILLFIENVIRMNAIGQTGTGMRLVFILLVIHYVAYYNLGLMVFNMIPVPPLDGFHVLLGIVPDSIHNKLIGFERNSIYVLMITLVIFNLAGHSPIAGLTDVLYKSIDGLCSLILKG